MRLFEELKERGLYRRDHHTQREARGHEGPQREPVIRFETGPGVQGQMDWSPYTIPFRRTGKAGPVFLLYTGLLRRQYIDFTVRHDFYSLIRRHQDAFQYYGGCQGNASTTTKKQ